MRQVRNLVSLLLAAVSLAGCTYDRGEGPPGVHFAQFRVAPPDGNSVEVCHAYTCAEKTTFYFRTKDIKEIAAVMSKTKKGDTPFQERRAIAYAIALIEKKVELAWNSAAPAIRRNRIAWTRPPTRQAT